MNFYDMNLIARREFANLSAAEQKRFYIAFTRDELNFPMPGQTITYLYNGPGYMADDEEADQMINNEFFLYFFVNFFCRQEIVQQVEEKKAQADLANKDTSTPSAGNTLYDLGPAATPFLQGLMQAAAEGQPAPSHFSFEETDAGMLITNTLTGGTFKCPLYAYRDVRAALDVLT